MTDLDRLWVIAESAPFLDSVEKALRQDAKAALADQLNKLQQDAGLAIDREMGGWRDGDVAPGPETAALRAAYEPVTAERLGLLRQISPHLEAGQKKQMAALIDKLLPQNERSADVKNVSRSKPGG
ncbi:MAG: hypothetical protein Q8K65_00265 [Alphaproteobacteria bacterium]|nr:hypothetical protein [Alphaproteobacteria bacterium]